MPAHILTGAPGAGKTAVLRLLEVDGFPVVEEAATDVIALAQALGQPEPWCDASFIDQVVTLQRQRQDAARMADKENTFFDRSPICTLALSRFLGFQESPALRREIDQALRNSIYEPTAFFIRNQGQIENTVARRISFADSLIFERLHEEVYRELGFQLIDVPAGPLKDRVALIKRTIT